MLNSFSGSLPIHIVAVSVMYSKLIRICKGHTTFTANIVSCLAPTAPTAIIVAILP